jgi:hypothetical protein
MADMHKAFLDFDGKIKLTQDRKAKILASRNAVREKIRKYFREKLRINQPRFRTQGSFTINTALNPIGENEVDTDDGVYLQHVESISDITPNEAHKLILDALEGHTQDGCEDKPSCVRILYRHVYHLDLPVYIMEGGKAFLARTKPSEWQHSDSKDFRDWFYNQRGGNEQVSRIVRYLKAWRDNREFGFSSIELTILAVKNFVAAEGRDDQALLDTLDNINVVVQGKVIKKPVAPYEDLWEELSNSEKDKRITQLKRLADDVRDSISNPSCHRASLILQAQFGDRFPVLEDKTPVIIKEYSAGAKPWGL